MAHLDNHEPAIAHRSLQEPKKSGQGKECYAKAVLSADIRLSTPVNLE
ncbi:hypothetical protein IQ244_17785 [Nostoc sp. LEGE 06077]|nr:hypothetical protein [Nostoc sp. LEGE 06077]MBE9208346.1 hypothetical protein [Nostoc sp. LEGE 06077]